MELKRAGSQPSRRGPAEWFTGTVRIDPLNARMEPVSDEQYLGGAMAQQTQGE